MNDLFTKIPLKKLSKKELYDIFDKMLGHSDITLISKQKSEIGVPLYKVKYNGKEYKIYVNIKNVRDAYLPGKPDIRRIQTKSLSFLEAVSSNSFFMLAGIAFYEDNPILVMRNAQEYIFHASNRSCYISLKNIEKGFEKGFYFTRDCNQDVYISNSSNLNQIILNYIYDNYSEGIMN